MEPVKIELRVGGVSISITAPSQERVSMDSGMCPAVLPDSRYEVPEDAGQAKGENDPEKGSMDEGVENILMFGIGKDSGDFK